MAGERIYVLRHPFPFPELDAGGGGNRPGGDLLCVAQRADVRQSATGLTTDMIKLDTWRSRLPCAALPAGRFTHGCRKTHGERKKNKTDRPISVSGKLSARVQPNDRLVPDPPRRITFRRKSLDPINRATGNVAHVIPAAVGPLLQPEDRQRLISSPTGSRFDQQSL